MMIDWCLTWLPYLMVAALTSRVLMWIVLRLRQNNITAILMVLLGAVCLFTWAASVVGLGAFLWLSGDACRSVLSY